MRSDIRADRKQIFGVEELDDEYLAEIRRLFEERVKELTLTGRDGSVTMPLTEWVY